MSPFHTCCRCTPRKKTGNYFGTFGCFLRVGSDFKRFFFSVKLDQRSKEKRQGREHTAENGDGGHGKKGFSLGSIAMLVSSRLVLAFF